MADSVLDAAAPPRQTLASAAPRSALERLPKWLICVPLVLQWLWLSLRYRSTTLPSAANPAITAGGLVGEGKLDYFNGMGPLARAATAPWCAISPAQRSSIEGVRAAMAGAGLVFPLIVKPDLGMCGFGVRLVQDEATLAAYFAAFPTDQTAVLQTFVPLEGEAGIFYARHPDEAQGRLIGLALRHFPEVVGDGSSSIAELMAAAPRTQRLLERSDHDFTLNPATVPPAGQMVRLSTIGSTRIGGLYLDGGACITPALTAVVDAIAKDMPEFYFGRFDVRFENLAQLALGRGLRIMEVNGAGSEAIQAWDPDTSLLQGFRTIFAKQALLFAIGAANRQRGHRPMPLRELARLHFMQQRLLDRYPPSN